MLPFFLPPPLPLRPRLLPPPLLPLIGQPRLVLGSRTSFRTSGLPRRFRASAVFLIFTLIVGVVACLLPAPIDLLLLPLLPLLSHGMNGKRILRSRLLLLPRLAMAEEGLQTQLPLPPQPASPPADLTREEDVNEGCPRASAQEEVDWDFGDDHDGEAPPLMRMRSRPQMMPKGPLRIFYSKILLCTVKIRR